MTAPQYVPEAFYKAARYYRYVIVARIFHEGPLRQERSYSHYHSSFSVTEAFCRGRLDKRLYPMRELEAKYRHA